MKSATLSAMQPRTVYVSIAAILLLLLIVLVASNPSEERHIDQYVANFIAWHDAHVEACPHCNTPADPQMVRRVFTQGEREGLTGLGLRRHNFLVCSLLAPETDGRYRTFGCFGIVFGPYLKGEFPCLPNDPSADALVEREEIPEPEYWIEISFGADGTTIYDGKQLTWDELIAELRNREDRNRTGVALLAHPQAKTSLVQQLISQLQEIGFRQFKLHSSK